MQTLLGVFVSVCWVNMLYFVALVGFTQALLM